MWHDWEYLDLIADLFIPHETIKNGANENK